MILEDAAGRCIPGETTDDEFQEKAIEIASFSLRGSASGDYEDLLDQQTQMQSGRLNDKLTLQVEKKLDKSSPPLMIAYCNQLLTVTQSGTKGADPFRKLTIVVRKAGETVPNQRSQAHYLTLIFELVYLTSYECSGQGGKDIGVGELPGETLEFRFKRFSMEYRPQAIDGRLLSDRAKTMRWNFYRKKDEPPDRW
jgi:type VI protein secretion system component Hcp